MLNTLPDAVQTAIRAWSESGWCPMGRMGTPEDIGNVVSLLCASEAGWITGQTIMADGGASLMDAVMPLEIQQPRG
ncbi:SDR family oxidoreductase [Sorangium sp. So ce134]